METIGAEKNNRQVLDKLKPYFEYCQEIISAMQVNLNNNNFLSEGITLIQCQEAISTGKFYKCLKIKSDDNNVANEKSNTIVHWRSCYRSGVAALGQQ